LPERVSSRRLTPPGTRLSVQGACGVSPHTRRILRAATVVAAYSHLHTSIVHKTTSTPRRDDREAVDLRIGTAEG
jgi:hypothetical protein